MRPVARSISGVLAKDIDDFEHSFATWDEHNRFLYRDLQKRALEFSRTDPEGGNLVLAKLASVIGDEEEVERWCTNLEHNHFADAATHMRFDHYVNSGQATKGLALLPGIVARRSDQNLVHLMHGAIAIGAFTAAKNALEAADMRQEVLVGAATFIEKVKSNQSVVAELGLEDSHLALMFDEAGAILREAHRNWASYELSVIAVPRSVGGPAMSVEWPVRVTPAEAAKLTWNLTDRLVEKDLDRPGFSLGFLGVKLQ